MTPQTFQLPAFDTPNQRVEWRLDARGLEWTGSDGHDRWMPYACIRLATLGNLKDGGWRLRLSGPPGAVIISAGRDTLPEDILAFSDLANKLIQGASGAGCRSKFRLNHKKINPAWLWARLGRDMSTSDGLLQALPKTAALN